MKKRVSRQVLLSKEGFVALGTFHGLFTFMHKLDVRGKTSPPIKGTIAMRARKRVLPSVMKNMRPQLSRLYEIFPAELTAVRFLPRVGAHVTV